MGSAGSPLGWSAPQVPGSLLADSLRAPVPAPCAPERQCARGCARVRECAGGVAGETLLFPLLLLGRSLRPTRSRPAQPGTLGSVVPALSWAAGPWRGQVTADFNRGLELRGHEFVSAI